MIRPRTVARELALLALSQLSSSDKLKDLSLDDLIQRAIQTLRGYAKERLQDSLSYIDSLGGTKADPKQMEEKVEKLRMAVTYLADALDLPAICHLGETEKVKSYALDILKAFGSHQKEVDAEIQRLTKHWKMERVASVDKNILRLAMAELLYVPDTPVAVTIDEAVELAKKYSTEKSSQFINGILGGLIKDHSKQ